MSKIISSTFAAAAIFTLSALTISPYLIPENTSASSVSFSANIAPAIAISLSKSTIHLDLSPTASGTAASDTTNVNVSTNNLTGYTLSMHMAGDNADLTQVGTTDKITATETPATTATLASNTWGYSKDTGDSAQYQAVPINTNSTNLTVTDTFSNTSITPLSFAAKVDTGIASGHYTNDIIFSAITNYVPPVFKGITTMQEMTASICEAETTPSKDAKDPTFIHQSTNQLIPEATLIDTRDNELYTVRKLADGNCWMSQNLRLKLSTEKPLTSSDSDVATNWTPTYNTQTTTGTTWGDASANEARSYVDTANKENGGLYTWYAATAGQGSYSMSTKGQNTTASICPKGWQLPEGYTSMNKSFGALTTTYYGTNSTTAHNNTIFQAPLSIVLSGYYSYNGGQVSNTGSSALLQSSTVNLANRAYYMGVNSSYVNPQSFSNDKANGLSVRCVARDDPENTSELTQALKDANAAHISASDGKEYYTMQSMTPSICGAVSTPAKETTSVPEATLIDARDNELYTVRKLADGNCWMSQNLRLKLTANQSLTSADTDVSSNFTPTISTQATSETTTSWGNASTASDVNKSRSYDTGNTNYGVYYNWFTATAGTGNYNMNSGNATGSICPKNWQLPLNDGTKSYYNLITTTYGLASNVGGSTKLQSAPLSFPLSGYYNFSGSVGGQGSNGFFWSATPVSLAYNAYFLDFNSSTIDSQYRHYKARGLSVRCVVRDDVPDNTSEITQALANAKAASKTAPDGKKYYTMQSMTSSICGAVSTPAKTVSTPPEATLIDTRDNELYTVRKLADGNCWMVDNLRLVGSKTLTSADSDVSSNFTLPAASTSGFASGNGYYTAQVAPVNTEYGNGAYYSWTAATAGTGNSSITAQNAEAPSSVCPKGWRLPYSGTTQTGSKSFKYLMDTYGYTTGAQLTAQPLQFAYSGYYYSSSFSSGGSGGYYWSSTAFSSNLAYYLDFYSSNVFPQNYDGDRYGGFSVRCVAR